MHLEDLALNTQGVQWRTEPGSHGAIQYGSDRVGVQQVRLVNGPQHLAIDGAFGGPGDALQVRAEAVDIASLNTLMLGQQKIGGTLSANATLTGTREAPRADATFSITNGSFREFAYQAFNGTIVYAVDGVRLDTRLSQTPDAWIAAKGFVPAAFFKPADAAETAALRADEHIEPKPGEQLDVAVTSSPISLGLIQAFAPQITKVSGTVQADVRVTGAAHDPHLGGGIDIRNGAFTIADLTNGGYTGLDTRITLAPDRVRLEEFSLMDEHQHTLRVSGELAVHQRQIGGVQIAIKSDQFEVIDNALADIKLNSDLRITGEMRAPRVEGTLGVQTGTVNIDKVLAQATSNAYAVEPTKVEAEAQGAAPPPAERTPASAATTPPPAPKGRRSRDCAPHPSLRVSATNQQPTQADAQAAPAGGLYDALALDVRLSMPDNLVIKGTDINPSGCLPDSVSGTSTSQSAATCAR